MGRPCRDRSHGAACRETACVNGASCTARLGNRAQPEAVVGAQQAMGEGVGVECGGGVVGVWWGVFSGCGRVWWSVVGRVGAGWDAIVGVSVARVIDCSLRYC